MNMKKKGISPLIATVLLIGFAVALAAVVMTWGLDFVRETAETTKEQTQNTLVCASDLSFAISDVQPGPTEFSITVDNRGQIDIVSIIFRVYTDTGVITIDSDDGTLDNDLTKNAVPKFGVIKFKDGTGSDFATNLPIATKVEAVATVPGSAGAADIVCPQNIQEYNI
jgi:flagellin-like protein